MLVDDGVCWLNLGDSYARQAGDDSTKDPDSGMKTGRTGRAALLFKSGNNVPPSGLKPKDLIGIPWRVAFALQADGWYLRSDIIWSKPNPMPESVTDRPTKAHEYVFLLTKNCSYFYDADAISERGAWCGLQLGIVRGLKVRAEAMGRKPSGNEVPGADANSPEMRNARTVWSIATQPYPGSHFATMPEKLAERCILAGSRPAGRRCDCNQVIDTPLGTGEIDDPSLMTGRAGFNRPRREDEGTRQITRREQREYAGQMRVSPFRDQMAEAAGQAFAHYIRTDRSGARPLPPVLLREWLGRGWLKEATQCRCPSMPADLVFDPFGGSGTTVRVARRFNRRGVMLDLNPAYLELAEERTSELQPMLLELGEETA